MVKMDENGPADVASLTIHIGGQRVHYFKAGGGPPVILVHGGASDARDWLPTMETLSGHFTFYAPDLIGFGESDRDEKGYYLGDFSDFLLGFIETLRIDRPALVGHSFGARICLDVALKGREKVSKLVLTDASGLGKISLLGNALFSGFAGMRRLLGRRQPFPRFLAREGEDYNDVAEPVLRGLTTPTLLIWKRHDPYLPVTRGRRAAAIIPDSQLVVLAGVGHAPARQDAKEFNRLLVDFLDHV
jgi:pimeloyl-ACP methyl ester carboxylesterase